MRLSIRSIGIAFILFLSNLQLSAQHKDTLQFYLDLPLLEFPFNTDSKYLTLSMPQSIKMTKNLYYATHFGIQLFGEKHLGKREKFWSKVILTVFDFAPIPFSNTWLHEEWHRSILTLHDVKSKNAHWTNSVKKVEDDALALLKLNHPADMVREATAGNEGNLEFVLDIQKDVFFDRVNTWNYGLYWGNYLVNSFYLFGSTRKDSKPLIKFKNSEDKNIAKRDANGYDPINATYDLFHPELAYAQRGIHPSGHGIDRYVEFADLSPQAQTFLKNQFSFSLLNFLDLQLFGINELGSAFKYNFSIRHHMTSFGHMIGGNIFFKGEKIGGIISPKIYRNANKTFAGIDLALHNKWGTLRLAGWQQPENQLYFDTATRVGGLIGLKITPPFKTIQPYLDLTFKSQGWVAGNPYLTKNTTINIGLKRQFRQGK